MENILFSRRQSLRMAALGGVAALTGLPAFADEDRAALARDAYVWGLPLVQTRFYLKLARQRGVPLNQLFGSPRLSTPASKVPGPNVDTLYGFGWLDVAEQPQILSVPDTRDRYYSIQLIDAYSNSFSYVGRRATGTRAGHYAIVGPNWRGRLPEGVTSIVAPTHHVLALTRTLVVDDADLPAARAVQAGFSLTPLADYPKIAHPDQAAEDALNGFPVLKPAELGAAYFDELSAALADDPPPSKDLPFVKRLAALGIGPGRKPGASADKALVSLLGEAPARADSFIRGRGDWVIGAKNVNGWRVAYGISSFIEDPLDRASANLLGPGAHIAQEALYFSLKNGPDGQPLSGDKAYLLDFPAGGLPPVDAFWSLTLYGGDWALVDNPINRYAIGDRTKGLRIEADGSLRLQIRHDAPAEGGSNWLPAPAGPYQLVLRAYQPRPALIDGAYQPPPLVLV